MSVLMLYTLCRHTHSRLDQRAENKMMLCAMLLQPQYCADALHTDVCTCCAGAYTAGLMNEEEMHDVVRNACPGAGACGGMYTANTMSSAIEAMGMSLPYSSSVPAVDPLKKAECRKAGK